MVTSIAFSVSASSCYSLLLLKQLVPSSRSCHSGVRGSSFFNSCLELRKASTLQNEAAFKRHAGATRRTICQVSRASSPAAAAAAAVEPAAKVEDFVEIGTIAATHGLYGELRVRSLTDFPQERFETPGIRWIRRVTMGKPSITQVELVEGRESIGKHASWLVTLKGFDTLEKASELQGATMLVRANERPASLGEDDDYIPDLVGMDVVLEETKEKIGTIVDVHSNRANDLLRVQLIPSSRGKDNRIWIPFVKDIVPVVDMAASRVEITPPEGLLDLNVPMEGPSRKEIRKEERKKKAIFSAIRKRLTALGQLHVLEGLSTGEESQRQELTDQLLSIDFGLFQRALVHARDPGIANLGIGELQPLPAIPRANWADFESWSNSKKYKKRPANSDNDTARWWFKGLQLIANGEVAVMVLAGGQATRMGPGGPAVKGMLELDLPGSKSLFERQAERLKIVQKIAKTVHSEAAPQIPWIVLTSGATDVPTRVFFEQNDYFGLEMSQVWFVKQGSLPCVDPNEGHTILLESPWKVATAPTGNGGLFSALHSQNITDRLSEEGVQYVQVYSVDNALIRVGDPVFFGYAHEQNADVGVKVVKRTSPDEAVGALCVQKHIEEERKGEDEEGVERGLNENEKTSSSSHYGVVEYNEMPDTLRTAKEGDDLVYRAAHICINLFSVDYLAKLASPKFELGFHSASKRIPCVKKCASGEWVTHMPDKVNGIKLEQFIFDAFTYCDPAKVAVLEVERNEEFAPIKNGVGLGMSDTAETARDMVLALQNRFSSISSSSELDKSGPDGETHLSLLRAFICGK